MDVSRLGTFRRVLASPRGALGSAAALDLSVRSADLTALGRVADLLAPVVSVAVGTVAAATFGTLTTWLLFAVAFASLTPRLFPAVARETAERPGFRALFGLSGVAFGWYLATGGTPLAPADVLGLLTLAAVCGLAVAGYLHAVADWDLVGPEGEAVALLDAVLAGDAVAERREALAYTGVTRTLADGLWVAATATVVVLPAFASGVLSLFLVRTYPLPDLLAVGYLVARPVADRVALPTPDATALEERVLVGARETVRTMKGAMLALLAGMGLFGAGGFGFLTIALGPEILELAWVAHSVAPGVAWVAVGAVCCLAASAAHLSWVWVRTFARLPAYLTRWRGAADPPDPPVARPPLSVVPGLLAFAVGVGCVTLFEPRPVPAVGLLWPVAPLAALGAVVVGRRRQPDPTTGEDHRTLAGVAAEFVLLFALSDPERLASAESLAAVVGAVVDALVDPLIGLVVVALVGVTYLPDAFAYDDAHEDWRRYASVAYLLALALGVVVFGVLPGGPNAAAMGLFAAFVVASAVALGVVKRRGL